VRTWFRDILIHAEVALLYT